MVAMKLLAVAATGILVLILFAKPLDYREKKKRARLIAERFGDRKPLDSESFRATYFSTLEYSRDTVLGVREVMEKVLEDDLLFLKDSDDFSGNLKFLMEFDSMADVELIEGIEKRFGIHISDQEAEATKTVRQLVDLVQTKRLQQT